MCSTVESLLMQGHEARTAHRLADAHLAYAEAVDLSRREGNLTLLAQCLKRLGGIERDLGQTREALNLYQQATALQRSQIDPDDLTGLAHTLRHIADILREASQPSAAAPYYDEALTLYRQSPETGSLDLANTLRGLALLKAETGSAQEAMAHWREAGALYAKCRVQAGVDESERQIAALSTS